MKNETAKREIESLDYYLQNHTDDYSEESHTAMMMAIKALEQEPCDVFDEYGNYKYPSDVKLTEPNTATSMPCEDAISREDALMCLTGEWTEITDEIIHRFIKRIKALPPVNPQPRWIPVSERLPEEYSHVLLTINGYKGLKVRSGMYYDSSSFHSDTGEFWKAADKEVIAWMPLPTPHVPETNIGKVSEIPTGSDPQESEKVN